MTPLQTPYDRWDGNDANRFLHCLVCNGWVLSIGVHGYLLLFSLLLGRNAPRTENVDLNLLSIDPDEYPDPWLSPAFPAPDPRATPADAAAAALQRARADSFAEQRGIVPPHTLEELLHLLVAVGLIDRDGRGRLRPLLPVLRPQDVLSVDAEHLADLKDHGALACAQPDLHADTSTKDTDGS